MSTLDIIILVCFVPAIVRGIQRGFIAQVVSLVSVVLGIWLAFQFSEIVCEWLRQYLPNLSETILHIIGFVLILAVVALLFHLVGKLILKIFKAVDLGWFNWILGILFSLLKAALIIGLVLVLFDTLNLKFELVKPETLDQSVLYAPIRDAAYKVFPYLKALLFKQ
jgi:membrane protein required for colicin V production